MLTPMIVRHVSAESPSVLAEPLFSVIGAPNVILDTVKRGEDDDLAPNHRAKTSVILRLYEAYGGHARALLRVSNKLAVKKAYLSNVLEDSLETIEPLDSNEASQLFEINFHGFQFQTVKLYLETNSDDHRERSQFSHSCCLIYG